MTFNTHVFYLTYIPCTYLIKLCNIWQLEYNLLKTIPRPCLFGCKNGPVTSTSEMNETATYEQEKILYSKYRLSKRTLGLIPTKKIHCPMIQVFVITLGNSYTTLRAFCTFWITRLLRAVNVKFFYSFKHSFYIYRPSCFKYANKAQFEIHDIQIFFLLPGVTYTL